MLTLDFTAALPLALILASYSFHLVPTSKLKALRLSVSLAHYHPSIRLTALKILAHHLTSTIIRAFESGSFLNSLPSSIIERHGYNIYVSVRFLFPARSQHINVPVSQPTSSLHETLGFMFASPIYMSLAPLSKLMARALSTLIESKPVLGLDVASRTLSALERLAKGVDEAWMVGGLDGAKQDDIGLSLFPKF